MLVIVCLPARADCVAQTNSLPVLYGTGEARDPVLIDETDDDNEDMPLSAAQKGKWRCRTNATR